MSTLVTNNVQLGSSGTATNNFTIYQPTTPDGTVRIGSGNSGTTSNLVTIDSAGRVGLGKVPVSGRGVLQSADTIEVPSINGGQIAGMRNKIINGKMDIAQRGTSFPTASGYTLDRWEYSSTSAVVATVTQQADAPSNNEFQNSYRYAVTTADASIAAGDVAAIQQRIEGFNARDLIGKTFTLSFWVRSSKTGIHCINFRNSAADRSYVIEYSISAANTWEQKSVTVSGGLITAGTWNWTNGTGLIVSWAMAAGTTFQTTANAWQTGNFLATSSQVNCLDTIGNIFAITGVQLEVGSVATPFEHRPFGAELALCQRYYTKTFNLTVAPAQNLGTTQGALYAIGTVTGLPIVAIWNFPVRMRVTPITLTTYNATAANANWSANPSSPTAGIGAIGESSVSISGSTNTSAGNGHYIHASAEAEL